MNSRSFPHARRRYADHFQNVQYSLRLPAEVPVSGADQHSKGLYIHSRRNVPDGERFREASRMASEK